MAGTVEAPEREGLVEIFNNRMKASRLAYIVERDGVTLSKEKLDALRYEYLTTSNDLAATCETIASGMGHHLKLSKGITNSLRTFCFGPLGLPIVVRGDAGTPSLNKEAMAVYEDTLPQRSKQLTFVKALNKKRACDTSLSFLDSYQHFWLPIDSSDDASWYRIHPILNPTGTRTLRWSSQNPNEQQISKRSGYNLRRCFGPAPNREWWSMDASNIELRIPAFEAGEELVMDVFNRPDDAPYYGSYHLVVFDILHPEMFAQHGKACKNLFEATWYQWVKNGNYAIQYGSQEGNADRSYHVRGAYRKIYSRFPKIAQLAREMLTFANKHGYVETIPNKRTNPKRGYRLETSMIDHNRAMPTVPLCYHVSGTACEWMQNAMAKCQEKLDEWRGKGFSGFITMQVHDELVFDFPKLGDPIEEDKRAKEREKDKGSKGALIRTSNLWRVRELQRLMESCGDDINIPTPVNVEYNPDNWAEGIGI